MVGHGGSTAGSYLANPTSPIPSHCYSSLAITNNVFSDHLVLLSRYISQFPCYLSSESCKHVICNHNTSQNSVFLWFQLSATPYSHTPSWSTQDMYLSTDELVISHLWSTHRLDMHWFKHLPVRMHWFKCRGDAAFFCSFSYIVSTTHTFIWSTHDMYLRAE